MSARPTPPRSVVILGVPFHDLTLDETLGRIGQAVRERTPRYLATANLERRGPQSPRAARINHRRCMQREN